MRLSKTFIIIAAFIFWNLTAYAQISPGDLNKAHANLEGVSNCTKCHSVGNKVTNEKCLNCHKDIQANIAANKGYHASSEVSGKQCATCHNDHHGRNFQIIKFDKKTFNHSKTGFELKGAHAKNDCKDCHKPAFIKDSRLKAKATTFMGLNKQCLTCHADHHQGKMSPNCLNCHNFESFKNATGFDHNTTKFPLIGKHKNLSCEKCHKTQVINGKPVQQFKGLAFANCNACHRDPHKNKFGQNCKQCHTEESFRNVKGKDTFDHDKTGFILTGKHKLVACKSCHKTNLTDPLKHDRCSDCHTDYHKKEFAKNGISPDCNQCHSTTGFSPSNYSVEKHNQTKFPLQGAHLATPCLSCHKKQDNWTFKNMGNKCVDCHGNPHKGIMQEKFLANDNCTACHTINGWKNVTFDHNQTAFKLEGVHARVQCSACHYKTNEKGIKTQTFKGLLADCSSCHSDRHAGQFDVNGKTDCSKCHEFDSWRKTKFDHNTARFKLDGAHATVSCRECHKSVTTDKGRYVQYKFKSIECSTCHS